MSIVAAAVIITGFGQVYPQHALDDTAPLPAIIHVHAAVFTCWLVLFIAQTTLVSAGRTDIHRRLGVAGGVPRGADACACIATAITTARLGHRGIPGVEFPDAQGFSFESRCHPLLLDAHWRGVASCGGVRRRTSV